MGFLPGAAKAEEIGNRARLFHPQGAGREGIFGEFLSFKTETWSVDSPEDRGLPPLELQALSNK